MDTRGGAVVPRAADGLEHHLFPRKQRGRGSLLLFQAPTFEHRRRLGRLEHLVAVFTARDASSRSAHADWFGSHDGGAVGARSWTGPRRRAPLAQARADGRRALRVAENI